MTKQHSYYCGIDPGATGAVVVVNELSHLVSMRRFDKEDPAVILKEMIEVWDLSVVVLEKVHSMPGQGVAGVFTFGVNYGILQGVLKCLGRSYEMIPPQTWQTVAPWQEDHGPKERVKLWAQTKWGLAGFVPAGCRVPHQGCIDAAGMAEYARQVGTGLLELKKPTKKKKKRRPIAI